MTLPMQTMRRVMALLLILGLTATAAGQTTQPAIEGQWNVRDFGAAGDRHTDDTAAFQKALDTAAEAGGGVVYAPPGAYRFDGTLNVPEAVTLKGVWESVPAHNGIREPGRPMPGADGTTFLVHGGRGSEEGAAFITLNTNSTLKGVCLWYPDQKPDEQPAPYPYAIAMRGRNPAVLEVEMLNPYNGIDARHNERHLIRNVHGQPLRRGVVVDAIYDIGRIENVHFNPWWSMQPAVFEWQEKHGEAFIFGRTDWQSVTNSFCFGYKVGFKFEQTEAGVCNGSFLGIGADRCQTAVLVEGSAPMGLLITNGQFVSFEGEDPTMVRVTASNAGTVRFVNCAFWGPSERNAHVAGSGTVGFSDCTFFQWDRDNEGNASIEAVGGKLLVRGCDFIQPLKAIDVGADARGVISGNIFAAEDAVEVDDGAKVVIGDNLSGAKAGD